MEGRASIDEKPISLKLEDAPRAPGKPDQQYSTGMQVGQPGLGVTSGAQAPFQSVFQLLLPPPWGVPAGTQGQWQPPLQPVSQGTNSSGQLSGQMALAPPQGVAGMRSISPAPTLAPVPAAPTPNIVQWFAYLDTHPQRNQDNIIFKPFGPILREKGYYRLHHLNPKYIKRSDLQQWLGIEDGTAIDIFEYAEEDLKAVKSGMSALPQDDLDT